MRRRSDEEIQAFLDQGGSAAEARDWEREELLDLRAYALIGSVPILVAGAGRVVASLAAHGRPDIVLAVAALLAGIALFDRVLSSLQAPRRESIASSTNES